MINFRIAALAATGTLAFVFAACSSDSAAPTTDESSAGQSAEAGATGDNAGAGNDANGGSAGASEPQAGANQGGDAGANAGGAGGSVGTLGDITVPASVTGATDSQTNFTDASMLAGFAGSHLFARGGKADMPGGTATLITDCKLTVTGSALKLEGGGQTITAPFISTNPNTKTLLVTYPDPAKIGKNQLMSFYDAGGSGLNIGIYAGRVTAVSASKTGTAIACNVDYASNDLTDRSLDTLILPSAAVSAITSKAGTNTSYTQMGIATSDLGGATGKAILGQGIATVGGAKQIVTDCQVEVGSDGAITVSSVSAGISESSTLLGASGDVVQVVSAQGNPTQLTFSTADHRVILDFNGYGFVRHIIALSANTDRLSCQN
ncbi:MAG: hypothetical protein ABI548_22155 [Polyangiaceae bacterium]